MDISEIEAKVKDFVVLLKHLPESLINCSFNEEFKHYDIIRKSLSMLTYDELNKTYKFEIETPRTINLQMYLGKVLREVFNDCGHYEFKDQNHCIYTRFVSTNRYI